MVLEKNFIVEIRLWYGLSMASYYDCGMVGSMIVVINIAIVLRPCHYNAVLLWSPKTYTRFYDVFSCGGENSCRFFKNISTEYSRNRFCKIKLLNSFETRRPEYYFAIQSITATGFVIKSSSESDKHNITCAYNNNIM